MIKSLDGDYGWRLWKVIMGVKQEMEEHFGIDQKPKWSKVQIACERCGSYLKIVEVHRRYFFGDHRYSTTEWLCDNCIKEIQDRIRENIAKQKRE